MSSPRRGTRLVVACVMTLWTLLQAATLVVAALRGGEPSEAFRFAYTGIVTMALTALTVVAWRWVARATPSRPPSAAGVPTDRGSTDALDPGRPLPQTRVHRGLSGHQAPPRRW